jgi:hypothetical protein
MSYRQTLVTLPNAAACVAAIDAAHALYRKEHKRNATVELLVSSYQDRHSVALYATDAGGAQADEVAWFDRTLKTLYPST